MSKGPGLYSDIGKKAKGELNRFLFVIDSNIFFSKVKSEIILIICFVLDLLTKDYNSDQKLTVSSYSTTGVVSYLNFHYNL